jgi:hypothetical protein
MKMEHPPVSPLDQAAARAIILEAAIPMRKAFVTSHDTIPPLAL